MSDSVIRHPAEAAEKAPTPPDHHGFYCGYSPERINPGDHEHRLTTIKKVTSGSTPEIAAIVDALYREIITAGTHPASSIRVAEAAKVIENTQRDLNIALMNELALIFGKLGIDTLEVLEAAGSKWNFLPFRPGLVGGHCIGVDPYYLTHKAVAIGYHPEVILAGRRINDRMGAHVAETVVKLMLQTGIGVCNSRILVLGLAFKENCPDLRNTRVIDIIQALREYNIAVDCYDPWIDRAEAKHEYGTRLPRRGPGRPATTTPSSSPSPTAISSRWGRLDPAIVPIAVDPLREIRPACRYGGRATLGAAAPREALPRQTGAGQEPVPARPGPGPHSGAVSLHRLDAASARGA